MNSNDIFKNIENFDWDDANIRKNWDKHQVSFYECEEVFFNEPLVIQPDTTHSQNETRYFALGKTNNSRLIFLAFTVREKKVRIISARDMSKKERKWYK